MTDILFIASALSRAGTETFMMNVFRGLPRNKYHVDFMIFTVEETDYTREIEASGSKVWRMVSRREGGLRYFQKLRLFFKQHGAEYHAIHWCGNSLSSIAPIYFAWRYNIPIRIVHAHNSYASGLHNRILHRLFRRFAARISTHHFACSTAAAYWFYGNSPDTIIIKNGIHLDNYVYNPVIRKNIRKDLDISDNSIVLGHIGRFCAEKNHIYLLDIFKTFLQLKPDAKLMLIGRGELEKEIEDIAKGLGIYSNVIFMGERSDVPQLLQAMDCFVLPSKFEGLPFVLVEAQASGLQCFISSVIDKDIAITPHVDFISIEEPASTWAKRILEQHETYHRKDTKSFIDKAGYSIDTSIRQIENIYNQH